MTVFRELYGRKMAQPNGREALYLGKSVVASDVVPRPGGTVLFRNRDCVDFADKIVSVVSGGCLKNVNNECKDYRKFYHEIYRV